MMKKFIFVLFFITAVVYGAFCQNGIIRELTGEVEYKRSGTPHFVRATVGDSVALNTLISTGFRSTAVIEIGSSKITVRPLTRLTLAEIQTTETTENVNLNLQSGRVRVDVSPPAGSRANFTVQGPSSTASVRGTSFEFDTVNLTVDEGRVIFKGNSGTAVIVDARNVSFVGTTSDSADPAEVVAALLLPPSPQGTPPPQVIAPSSSSSGGSGLVGADIELNF